MIIHANRDIIVEERRRLLNSSTIFLGGINMSAKYLSNKNALVYARESRDDFGEKYERIETQRDILLEFCKKNGEEYSSPFRVTETAAG